MESQRGHCLDHWLLTFFLTKCKVYRLESRIRKFMSHARNVDNITYVTGRREHASEYVPLY